MLEHSLILMTVWPMDFEKIRKKLKKKVLWVPSIKVFIILPVKRTKTINLWSI